MFDNLRSDGLSLVHANEQRHYTHFRTLMPSRLIAGFCVVISPEATNRWCKAIGVSECLTTLKFWGLVLLLNVKASAKLKETIVHALSYVCRTDVGGPITKYSFILGKGFSASELPPDIG